MGEWIAAAGLLCATVCSLPIHVRGTHSPLRAQLFLFVLSGRLDRKVEFGLPDLEGRGHILRIHSKRMNCDRDIRFELIARLCPNTTGAELHSVCTEAGMFSIRARRKSVSEKDFLDSVTKVIKGYKKFSSTQKYMVYN